MVSGEHPAARQPGVGADDGVIAKAAATIVSSMEDQVDDITRSTQELLVTEIAELRGDTPLLQLLRDTVASNIDTFFSAIRHRISIEHIEPPAAALEYARRLAQREVSANALVRAYRLGHQAVLKIALEEIRVSELDPKLSLGVYELIAGISFGYIDRISQLVLATYQDERDRWLGNRNTMRTARVRDLIAGGDVDSEAAEMGRSAIDDDGMTAALEPKDPAVRSTHLEILHDQLSGFDTTLNGGSDDGEKDAHESLQILFLPCA